MTTTNITQLTGETFEQEVIGSDLPVLVDFWATWCGPCRKVAPIMEDLANRFAGKLKVCKLDVDASGEKAEALGIMSLPTVQLYYQGALVSTLVGTASVYAYEDELRKVGLEY